MSTKGSMVMQIRVQQLNFLLTGIFSTVCHQVIFNQGGAEQSTLLLSLPSYLGMLLLVVLPEARQDLPLSVNYATLTSAAVVDVAANILCIYGLMIVGSGMYQVLHSSVVLFAALMSRFILGKEVMNTQWLGIIIMAIGLATTSFGGHIHHAQVKEQLTSGDEEMVHIMFGVGVTAVGCVGYAASYVLGEYVLQKSPTLPPQRLCVQVGSTGTMLLALHFATHTIPKWDVLVTQNIVAKGGNSVTIALLYCGLVICSFMHNWAHFYLLRSTGAVSTGVLQSLRSIGVFVVSGTLFCEDYPTQCMTSLKSLACLIVSTGVLVYSYGSYMPSQARGACGGGAVPETLAAPKFADSAPVFDHENPQPMSAPPGNDIPWGASGKASWVAHGEDMPQSPRRKGASVALGGWLQRVLGTTGETEYASGKKSEDGPDGAELLERRTLASLGTAGSCGDVPAPGHSGSKGVDENPAFSKRHH